MIDLEEARRVAWEAAENAKTISEYPGLSQALLDPANTVRDLCDEVGRLKGERTEAARLGYCAGHNDTVESCYADPGEVARDICQELDEGRGET